MMTWRFVAVVAGLGLASAAVAGPLQAKRIPAAAKWLLHVDMDAVAQSSLWPAIEKRVHENPGAMAKLNEIEMATGLRLLEDVHSVTLCGAGFGEGDGVVILQATIDQGRILQMLELNPAYASEPYGTKQIVSWEDKGKTTYGTFFAADGVIIAQNKSLVKQVIDTMDGKAESLKADAILAQPVGAGVLAGIAGDGLGELARRDGNPVLKQAKAAWFSLAESDKNLVLRGMVEAIDEGTATKLKNMAEGMKAAGLVFAAGEKADPKLKAVAPLLTSLTFGVQGRTVSVEWTAAADAVQQTSTQLQQLRGQK